MVSDAILVGLLTILAAAITSIAGFLQTQIWDMQDTIECNKSRIKKLWNSYFGPEYDDTEQGDKQDFTDEFERLHERLDENEIEREKQFREIREAIEEIKDEKN